jgi:hypothetical protein
MRERIDRLGPVQDQKPDAAFGSRQDFIKIITRHGRAI